MCINQMYGADVDDHLAVADEEHSFIDFFVSNITPRLAGSKMNNKQ